MMGSLGSSSCLGPEHQEWGHLSSGGGGVLQSSLKPVFRTRSMGADGRKAKVVVWG